MRSFVMGLFTLGFSTIIGAPVLLMWNPLHVSPLQNLFGGLLISIAFIGAAAWFVLTGRAPQLETPDGIHCVRCGYDMRGLNSDRCPECGWRIRDESTNS